jgi:hypothetical protein
MWARSNGRLIVYQNAWMCRLGIPPMPIPKWIYRLQERWFQSSGRRQYIQEVKSIIAVAAQSLPSATDRAATSGLYGTATPRLPGTAPSTGRFETPTMTDDAAVLGIYKWRHIAIGMQALADDHIDLDDRAAVERALINPYSSSADPEISKCFFDLCIETAKLMKANHQQLTEDPQ